MTKNNHKDIIEKRIADILGHHHWEVCDCDLETNPHHCPVEVFYPELIKLIEDNEIAHTQELEELDRRWRDRVAGLRMDMIVGENYDDPDILEATEIFDNGYNVAIGNLNSKITQLLEEE